MIVQGSGERAAGGASVLEGVGRVRWGVGEKECPCIGCEPVEVVGDGLDGAQMGSNTGWLGLQLDGSSVKGVLSGLRFRVRVNKGWGNRGTKGRAMRNNMILIAS